MIAHIESKYAVLTILQVLLEKKLINKETYDNIIRHEYKNYPIA